MTNSTATPPSGAETHFVRDLIAGLLGIIAVGLQEGRAALQLRLCWDRVAHLTVTRRQWARGGAMYKVVSPRTYPKRSTLFEQVPTLRYLLPSKTLVQL